MEELGCTWENLPLYMEMRTSSGIRTSDYCHNRNADFLRRLSTVFMLPWAVPYGIYGTKMYPQINLPARKVMKYVGIDHLRAPDAKNYRPVISGYGTQMFSREHAILWFSGKSQFGSEEFLESLSLAGGILPTSVAYKLGGIMMVPISWNMRKHARPGRASVRRFLAWRLYQQRDWAERLTWPERDLLLWGRTMYWAQVIRSIELSSMKENPVCWIKKLFAPKQENQEQRLELYFITGDYSDDTSSTPEKTLPNNGGGTRT